MPQINLDCEGPLTLNDNAFELCAQFIPKGDRFFALVSRYDDYLADVERRPGYKAGDTLKLILPFLTAYEVDNKLVREFSRQTLKMLPGTPEVLTFLRRQMPAFIISTSYRPYLEALCEVTGFPMEQVFCTEVDFDRHRPRGAEKRLLRELAAEIAAFPMIDLPEGARGFSDLPAESQQVVERLNEIFWKTLPELETGRFLEEVNPIGGPEKARATKESLEATGLSPEEVLYIGDSITDVEAFELVKEAGGGAVSFNGNRYALRAAEFFALALQAGALGCLALLFASEGRQSLLNAAQERAFSLCQRLPASLAGWEEGFSFGLVAAEDLEELVEKSLTRRQAVRGHAIGVLG